MSSKAHMLSRKTGSTTPSNLLEYTVERKYVSGIDAKTVATSTIFKTEAGLGRFCITKVIIEVDAASAEPDTPQATISIGTAAGADQDVVEPVALTQTLSANDVTILAIAAAMRTIAESTAVRIAVTTAATSVGTLTYRVHVIGFYVG